MVRQDLQPEPEPPFLSPFPMARQILQNKIAGGPPSGFWTAHEKIEVARQAARKRKMEENRFGEQCESDSRLLRSVRIFVVKICPICGKDLLVASSSVQQLYSAVRIEQSASSGSCIVPSESSIDARKAAHAAAAVV